MGSAFGGASGGGSANISSSTFVLSNGSTATMTHGVVTDDKFMVSCFKHVAASQSETNIDFLATDMTFQDANKICLNGGYLILKDSGSAPANVAPTNLTNYDSGRVIYGSEYATYQSWHVFDGNDATTWFSNTADSNLSWVGYVFDAPGQDVTKYRFFKGGSDLHKPDAWYIEYSDNGSSWSTFDHVTGTPVTAGTWYTSGVLTSVGAHRYWRFRITNVSTGNLKDVEIGTLEFWAGSHVYPTTDYWYATTTDTSHLSLSGVSSLIAVNITTSEPANTDIKMLVSFDGRSTWKKWSGTVWTNSSLASIATGNDPADVTSGLSWYATSGSTFLDFAFALQTTDSTASSYVDNVQILYAASTYIQSLKMGGYADSGVDCGVKRLTSTTTEVKNLSGSTLKIVADVLPGGITSVGQFVENVNVLGNCTGNQTLDLSLGNIISATLTGSGTWTLTNPAPAGKASTVTIYLTNGGAFTITWAVTPKWPGGMVPTLTAAGLDIIILSTLDGGTTWSASIEQDVK